MSNPQIIRHKNQPKLTWKQIPGLRPLSSHKNHHLQWRRGGGAGFATVSMMEKTLEFEPTPAQLWKHPLAIVALVPKDAAVFAAGALSGAAAKTVTAPLDRIKLIMQTHGLRVGQESAKKTLGFIQAFVSIGKQEGIKGYWKGNFAQVTYPLDVLRLRLAVDPGYQTMTDVFVKMLKEEGLGSFYRGLGPSLIGIAPYVAVNFCVFDFHRCNTYMLPIGYYQKTNANEGYTLQKRFRRVSSIKLTTFDAMKRMISASEKEFQRILEENRNEQKQSANDSTF
ncbi:Mitochondrial carrier domain-containing protein [Cynara cardunculus var. scolymus]|uniref:Mitochondrial carrier domain-containing protein n=1 Tax=Cynara cardunculus var. scolymus TaxID=59895 RepID=A0A103XQ45_CYNCS|nr:Mitochondrial carrier domain-containing protein [Cynara cardunculus var. scolymus]